MKRIAVEIPVRAPFDVLRQFVQELAEDRNLAQAYFKLRGTTSPSRVVENTRTRVAIYEPAFDPSIRAHGMLRSGWTVTYTLTPADAAETRVEIAVAYNLMTAVIGMGLIKAQAENEVIHRIGALLAFEKGYHTDRSAAAEGDAGQAPRLLEAPRSGDRIAPSADARPHEPARRT